MTMGEWHLDKRLPISIIGTIALQTIIFVYVGTSWKDNVDSRLAALEKSDDSQQSHEGRLITLEQQFGYIRADLAEIKELLKRQIPASK
jgi:predicted transcriptional regulator